MAVIEGGNSGELQEVDADHQAARSALFPIPALAWSTFALRSGALTGLAADDPVLSFRNISSKLVLVRRLAVGFVTTTAFSAAQLVDFGLSVARSFSGSDSAGNAVTLTGDNASHRSALAALTSADLRIANTGTLTAGTRTLDASRVGAVAGWSGGVGESIQKQLVFDASEGHPLVLAQNEGLVLAAITAFGAAGVGRLYVDLEVVEVDSY